MSELLLYVASTAKVISARMIKVEYRGIAELHLQGTSKSTRDRKGLRFFCGVGGSPLLAVGLASYSYGKLKRQGKFFSLNS